PPPELRELTVSCKDRVNYISRRRPISISSRTSEIRSAQMGADSFGKRLQAVDSFQAWLGKLNFENLVKIALTNIKGMPHSFTQLLQLQYLTLRNCSKLVLPDLGKISTLEYLDLEGCYSLQQCPKGTIAQRSLKYLNVLYTNLKELPEHLEQLENLEQLRVTTLPEDIVWMNIKFLDVQDCGITGFKIGEDPGDMPLDSFQTQGGVHNGELLMKTAHHSRVSCLTILMIKSCSISKLYIPRAKSLFPNLEIVDLSNNESLTDIEGLPGNLIRLDLMNCLGLKTMTCLSNLASLKYLNISGCDGLKTVNVQDLSSIEVIKAEECWELQSIKGLGQLQKLAHFEISTGNSVFSSTWRDIMTFPSNISSAILWGGTVHSAEVDKMYALGDSFEHVKVTSICANVINQGSGFSVKLEDESLEGAILVCLIALMDCEFGVRLGRYYYTNTNIFKDDENTYRAHMLMWTKHSDVLKDLKFGNDQEGAYCEIKLFNPITDSKVDGMNKGWIVMAKQFDFCKQFLTSLFDGGGNYRDKI
ncbi:hypothetical protein KI387_000221, partial [Taxus chinensis]